MRLKKTKGRQARSSVNRLSHPVATKLSLLHHSHSGRLVHRHHTSYAVLVILLVITGFFVFIGYDIAVADNHPGNVAVSLKVQGPAPTVGAVITSPKNGDEFSDQIIEVKGTCAENTTVIVYSNNTLVGSTLCSPLLKFQLSVQLFAGENRLTALNYDTLNQAGPVTPDVNVVYDNPTAPISPSIPIHPIVVPGIVPMPPLMCPRTPDDEGCNKEFINKDTCEEYSGSETIPSSRDVRTAVI